MLTVKEVCFVLNVLNYIFDVLYANYMLLASCLGSVFSLERFKVSSGSSATLIVLLISSQS